MKPIKLTVIASLVVVAALGLLLVGGQQQSLAQAKPERSGDAFKYKRLDKSNAAVLLVDHQSGLISLVQDFSPGEFKNNVLALADLAKYFKLPVILTTSFEQGPNGPLVPELKQMFPEAAYIPRPGQINAWDNEEFVKAVKATGKKQLIIAGVVTEVCVAFPALSALEEDFEVFIVADASGTFNEITQQAAWSRMEGAGAQLMTWFGVACELHRDWRNDIEGLGRLFSNHIPNYRNLMTSYDAIQAAHKSEQKPGAPPAGRK
jgi:nicotinamidase-related amidase